MNLKILQATKSDLKEILVLQKECYLSEAEIYNDYNMPPLKQDIELLLNEFEQGIILKCIINNRIIGSVRAFRKNNTCYIGKLIVDKNFQNRGIGKLLIKNIESKFNDCKRFELFTGHKSEKNLYLYNKLGYQKFNIEEASGNLNIVYLEKVIK